MEKLDVPPEKCGTLKKLTHFLSGKWNLPICIILFKGPKRFNEIKEELSIRVGEEVCSSSISHALKNLEEQGYVIRNVVIDKTPIKVYYELTSKGKALKGVIKAILDWAEKYGENTLN